MNVTISEVSAATKQLTVEIPWPEVSQSIDDAYAELQRGVAVKGYRKGKAPREVLQDLYGRRVLEEVKSSLVQASLLTAVRDHALDLVAAPEIVGEVVFLYGSPMKFEATVEVKSAIEPKDYLGLAVRRGRPLVGEADVDEALERLRQGLAEYLPIAGRVSIGRQDRIVCNLRGMIGEIPLTKSGVLIDMGQNIDPIPGFVEALIGMRIDARDQEVAFTVGEFEAAPHLQGLEAKLIVSIEQAREKEVPILDDHLARDLDIGETLSHLRDKVRADLIAEEQREIEAALRQSILDAALLANPFQPPLSLVERHISEMLRLKGLDEKDKAKREELRPESTNHIRGLILVDAIADKEGIQVADEELAPRLATLAKDAGISPDQLRAQVEADGTIATIRRKVRFEKTIDFLIEKAIVDG